MRQGGRQGRRAATTTTLVIAAAVTFASVTYARQTAARTPTTVTQVMTAMTVPVSDAIFDATAEHPATAEAWAALRKSAVTLAESGRLLRRTPSPKARTRGLRWPVIW